MGAAGARSRQPDHAIRRSARACVAGIEGRGTIATWNDLDQIQFCEKSFVRGGSQKKI